MLNSFLFADQRKNCSNAFLLCDTSSYTEAPGGYGADFNDFLGGGPSCSNISFEVLPFWYKFQAANSGNFEFGIFPNDSSHNWDFSLYDITGGCGAANWIELACNDSAPNCGPTGISSIEQARDTCNPTGETNWQPTLSLVKDHIYVIYVGGNQSSTPPPTAFFTLKFHMNGLPNPVLFKPLANANPPGPVSICSTDSIEILSDEADIYQWYRNGSTIAGATDSNYFAKLDGDYTIKVSNTLGCSDSLTNAVTANVITPMANITPAGPITICDNDSTTLTSDPADTYQWYRDGIAIPGATDQTYNAKIAGDYTIKITQSGCSDSLTTAVTLNVNPAPTANILPAGPINICDGDSVELTADPTSFYQWYRNGSTIVGATDQSYFAETAGSYTVKVTDAIGCFDSLIIPVVATVTTPTANVTPVGPVSACAGDSIELVADAENSYQWYRNGSTIAGATDSNYFVKLDGNYTIKIFNNGCPDSLTTAINATFNSNPIANVTLNSNDTVCLGDSAELTSDPATTYQWYRDGAIIAGATDQKYFPKVSGTYTIVVTNGFGCEDSLAIGQSIDVLPSPPSGITPPGPVSICNGDSIELVSNNASTYQWYRNGTSIAGATDSNYFAKLDGNYTIVVSSSGCFDSLTTPISVSTVTIPIANVNPSGSINVCNGDSVELVADPADLYQWYQNGMAIAGATSQSFFAKSNGSYTVKVTNGGICFDSLMVSVDITIVNTPTASITPAGPLNICNGDSIELVSNSADSYQWYRDGSTIIGATDSNYFAKVAGNYTLKVTNSGLCSDSTIMPVLVSVTAVPVASVTPAGPFTICSNDSVELVSDPAGSYQWYRNGTIIAGATDSNYFAKLDGNYTIKVINGGICSDSLSTAVNVSTIATTTANITPNGTNNICSGDSIELVADAANSYEWYRDGGIIPGATDSNFFAKTAGNYTLKVTNGGICADSTTVPTVVNIFNTPVASITQNGLDTICLGDSTELVSDNIADNYEWYRNGSLIGGASDSNFFVQASGSYTLKLINGGVCSDSLNIAIDIRVMGIPNASVSPLGPFNICGSDSVLLTSTGATGYQWYQDGMIIPGAMDTFYYASAAGNYTIVVDSFGCSDSLSTPVVVNLFTGSLATVSPSGSLNICSGDSIELTASDADTFQWYRDGILIAGATDSNFFAKTNGDYTVVVKTTTGCRDSLATPVQVSVNLMPTANIVDTNGSVIICDGQETVELVSESEIAYQWLLNGGPIAGETDSNLLTNLSGSYQVVAISGINCSDTSFAVVISANPTPTASLTTIGLTTLCNDDSVTFLSDSIGTSYEWYKDNILIAGATDSFLTVDTSGSYNLVIKNALGCADTSAPINVTYGPAPTIAPIANTDIVTICEDESIIADLVNNDNNIDANTVINIITGPKLGGTNILSLDSISYTPDLGTSGTDTIVYQVCNPPSACDTSGITVCDLGIFIVNISPINSPPEAINDTINVCINNSIIIAPLDNDNNSDGDHLDILPITGPNNGTVSIKNDTFTYTPGNNFSGVDSFFYSITDSVELTACNTNGSFTDTGLIYIIINPENQQPFVIDTVVKTCINEAVVLNVNSLVVDPDNDALILSDILASNSKGLIGEVNEDSIIYEPLEEYTGTDTIWVQACDISYSNCGQMSLCDTFMVIANISAIGECDTSKGTELTEITIPNGFSPNGDNVNDLFEITGIEDYPNAEIVIFNRWGNKVFESATYKGDWNGLSRNGTNVPDGTYFYILKLDEIQKAYEGYVEIHR